eukprot:scaffold618202_cov110-Attheya_sp.AAC.4
MDSNDPSLILQVNPTVCGIEMEKWCYKLCLRPVVRLGKLHIVEREREPGEKWKRERNDPERIERRCTSRLIPINRPALKPQERDASIAHIGTRKVTQPNRPQEWPMQHRPSLQYDA